MKDIMEFIVKVRTYKQENNIPSDAQVCYQGKHSDIVLKMLKVKEENLTDNISDIGVTYNGYSIYYIFDNSKNLEEEKNNLLKEKEKLEVSIQRRKNLLNNPNYVAKAPETIVRKEREDLEREETNLKEILKKIG